MASTGETVAAPPAPPSWSAPPPPDDPWSDAPWSDAPAPAAGFTSLRDRPSPVYERPGDDDDAGKGRRSRKAKKSNEADKAARSSRKRERRRNLRGQLRIQVPAMKAAPSAAVVTAVGATVAGLVLVAVISVVVTRGSTHHVTVSQTASSSSDACQVVSPEVAAIAFARPAGQPHFVLDTCVYDDGTDELIVEVYRQNAQALFDAGRSGLAQDVPGVGDAAYYVDGRLRVLKATSLLLVTLGPDPTASPDPKLLSLATTAVGRL